MSYEEGQKSIADDEEDLNLAYNYSQEELKEFFFHKMTTDELEKINSLNLDDIISKLQSSTYSIKYINNVGYTLIGLGYLILRDGTEPTHFFAKIYADAEDAKKEIMNIFNK